MAELHVQKKRSSPLPWIILALLVLGIVGYLVWRNSDKSADTAAPAMTDSAARAVPPVAIQPTVLLK